MEICEARDPLALHDKARRLADIHTTSLVYELDRQAREHDHPSWEVLMSSYPGHLSVALTLQQQWLRPATDDDGDIGGWPVVPTYNPIHLDRLPAEGHERDVYLLALATLMVRTSIARLPGVDRDAADASRLGAAFLRWEVTDALAEDRIPSLVDGGNVLARLHERVLAQAAIGKPNDDHLSAVLQAIASERRDVDPEGSALLDDLAGPSIGWRLTILGKTERAFRRFRNPGIAALLV